MKQGFLQALGVAVYCTFVGLFMWNANTLIGKVDSFIGPVTVIVLFSTSALVCGVLVFFKPYKLFLAGKKKEALNAVVSTALWLFIFFLAFLAFLFVKNR